MKRVEFSELPKLHAICNRWMHFSVHFWSSFWGFGAPAKNRPQRQARITSVHFFSCEKSQSFVAIWNDFPNLAQFFERPTLVDQSSANSSRLLTKLSGMLRFGVRFSRFEPFWNVRVLVDQFAVQKMPPAESEYRWSGTKKREKKRCLDGWRMHRTARYARKNVHSAGKKKKVASPRYLA